MSGGGRLPLAGVVRIRPRGAPAPGVPGLGALMARRNLLRSVLAASVMVVSGGGALLATAAAAPAGAVDNNRITVTVRDSGFSETNITARVGDQLIFVLDAAATQSHTLAWDRGQIQFKFDHNGNASKTCDGGAGGSGPYVCYPMNNHGQAHFYDNDHVRHPHGAALARTLTETHPPPPPPEPRRRRPPSPGKSRPTTAPR